MKTGARTQLILIYAFGLTSVSLTIALAWLSNRPVDHFVRDPLAVMNAPAYVGLLSNITAMAWFSGASGAWLIAAVMLSRETTHRRGVAMGAVAGVLAMLGVDDLFMIHEELLQRYLGVPEQITMATYALIAIGVAFAFRDVWRGTPWRLLIPAALCFAAAIAVDVLTTGFGWRLVVEDGFKFLGVVTSIAWVAASAVAWLAPHPDIEAVN